MKPNERARDHFRGEAELCWRNLQLPEEEQARMTETLSMMGYKHGYPYLLRKSLWEAVDRLVKMGDTDWVRETLR